MKPSSPVIPGENLPETVIAKDQPEYIPLPVCPDPYQDGVVISRWHCTWQERLRILLTGDAYLHQMTFGRPLQPVKLEVERPIKRRGRIREWIGRRCHWQNLNEDRNGKVKGSILRYGRIWFHRIWKADTMHRDSIEFCWSLLGSYRWIGFGIRLFSGDSHRDVSLSFAFWFASLYLTFQNILPERFGYPRHRWDHYTGITISNDGGSHGPSVSIDLHYAGGDCWECKGWKGPHWYWWPLDTLLGAPVYSSKSLGAPSAQSVSMPEGEYPVSVELTEDSWKRPRWPWPKVVRRARLDCPVGIPIPGKGENSWDCDDGATFGLTTCAATVEEALAHLKDSVERRRERHGGKGWLPEKATV